MVNKLSQFVDLYLGVQKKIMVFQRPFVMNILKRC